MGKHIITLLFICSIFHSFSQDTILPINVDGQWGAINTKKEIIISPQYKKLEPIGFSGFMYAQDKTSYYFISKDAINQPKAFSADYIDVLTDSWIRYLKQGMYGLYNPQINKTIDAVFSSIIVEYKKTKPYFSCISSAGYRTEIYEDGTMSDDIIYQDSTGLHIITQKNNRLTAFGDSIQQLRPLLYAFRENNLWGAYDFRNSEIIMKPQFEAISTPRSAEWSLIAMNNSVWGIYDTCGQLIAKPQFTDVEECDSIFKVAINSKYGFIDRNGKQLVAPQYDTVWMLNDKYFAGRKASKCEITNEYGETFAGGYDSLAYLDSTFIAIYQNQKIGLFNVETKSVVVEPLYEHISRLTSSNLLVKLKNHYGVLSLEGKLRFPTDYDSVFVNGLFIYLQKNASCIDCGSNFGLGSIFGDKLLDCKYSYSSIRIDQRTGTIKVPNGKGKMIQIEFDDNGKILAKTELTNVLSFSISGEMKKETIPMRSQGSGAYYNPYPFEFYFRNQTKPLSARNIIALGDKFGIRHKHRKNIICIEPTMNCKAEKILGDSVYIVSRFGKVNPTLYQNENGYRLEFFVRSNASFSNDEKIKLMGVAKLYNGEVSIPVKVIMMPDTSFKNTGVCRLIDKNFRFRLMNRQCDYVRGGYSFIDDFIDGTTRFAKDGRIEISKDSTISLDYLPDFKPNIPTIHCYKRQYNNRLIYINNWYPALLNARWGIIDTTGKVLIKPEYTFLSTPYKHRYIAAKTKWGIIDDYGSTKVNFVWDKIEYFPNLKTGRTIIDSIYYKVKLKKRWGVIDSSGKELLPPSFDQVYYYGNPQLDMFAVSDSGKMRLINKQQQYVNNLSFAQIEYLDTVHYTYRLRSLGSRYAFINPDGTYLTDAIFDEAKAFQCHRAQVKRNGSYYFIDRTGKTASKPYKKVMDYSYNLAAVLIDSLWGYIDTADNIVIKPQFISVGNFIDSTAWVTIKNNNKLRYCFINREGEIIKKTRFDSCSNHNNETFIVYRQKGKTFRSGLLTDDLKKIIRTRCSYITAFNEDGLACINIKTHLYLIDRRGVIKGNAQVNQFGPIENGIMTFRRKNLWGIMDTAGNVLAEPRWISIGTFVNGKAMAERTDRSRCFINEAGVELFNFKYVSRYDREFYYPCNRQTNGMIDEKGTILLTCNDTLTKLKDTSKKTLAKYCLKEQTNYSYYYQNELYNNLLKVSRMQHPTTNKWGLIDKNRVEITPVIFDAIDEFVEGVAVARINNNYGIVDSQGAVLAPIEYYEIRNYYSNYISLRSLKSNRYLHYDGRIFWENTQNK